jgi:hypothetical protein
MPAPSLMYSQHWKMLADQQVSFLQVLMIVLQTVCVSICAGVSWIWALFIPQRGALAPYHTSFE